MKCFGPDSFMPLPPYYVFFFMILKKNTMFFSIGFLRQTPRTCCGAPGVGKYNFNLTSMCGNPDAYNCIDPSNHWSWDGVHLTEAAYCHALRPGPVE
jgi:hypothetical protein